MNKKICSNGRLWGSHNSYDKAEYRKKLSLKKLGKKNHNISLSKSGEKNPAWKGGNSYKYQSSFFLPLAKTLNQHCSMCNSKDKLLVHHIDFNYKNNVLNNLTIVCRSCHNKIHKTKSVGR